MLQIKKEADKRWKKEVAEANAQVRSFKRIAEAAEKEAKKLREKPEKMEVDGEQSGDGGSDEDQRATPPVSLPGILQSVFCSSCFIHVFLTVVSKRGKKGTVAPAMVQQTPHQPVVQQSLQPQVMEPQILSQQSVQPQFMSQQPVQPQLMSQQPVQPQLMSQQPVQPQFMAPQHVQSQLMVQQLMQTATGPQYVWVEQSVQQQQIVQQQSVMQSFQQVVPPNTGNSIPSSQVQAYLRTLDQQNDYANRIQFLFHNLR